MSLALRPAIKRGVKYLQRVQESTGNFVGQAGPERADFIPTVRHSTVFFTCLILDCLADIPGTQVMKRRAADFLLTQKSDHWSWNYWQRGSRMAKNFPYPDDLDDTACALAAITKYTPHRIDGAALGKIAQLLIYTEIAPGGPYRTWLIDNHTLPQWSSIDIAVNANIGYFLSLHDVELPALTKYISHALLTNDLSSQYYLGTIPNLYFIARWYHGPELECLQTHLAQEIKTASKQSDLMAALLLSAGCHAGLETTALKPLADRLMRSQHRNDAWPPAPLYRDPQMRGITYLAGSAALTTAFVIEALNLYAKQSSHHTAPPIKDSDIIKIALKEDDLPSTELRKHLHEMIRHVSGKNNQQIIAMAQITAAAFGRELPPAVQKHLNLASIYGWTAYTAYDDFLDNEGRPVRLGAANVAQRLMLDHFQLALPNHHLFHQYVQQSLQTMDSANTWEVTYARGNIEGRLIHADRPPDYGDYHLLADRSWGHVLAAIGSLLGLGLTLESPEVKTMEEFFRHFLIAKQLNDDAHDWEDDLARGHLSSAVSLLLADKKLPLRINLDQQGQELRLHFWQETILEIVQAITEQCALARRALDHCPTLHDSQVHQNWVRRQELSCRQAIRKRQDTYHFISSYQQQ